MCGIYSQCNSVTCPESDPHAEWVIIGYDTECKHDRPLFKVYQGTNLRHTTVAEAQDTIAENQAMRSPHIIYTVVKHTDLWL